jgi:uncharacterized protein (DUF58 family)
MKRKLNPPPATPKITTRVTGLLLSPWGLVVVGVILLWAAWNGMTIVVVIAGLAVSTAGLAWAWGHLAMKNLRGECYLSDSRVFPDDQVELKLRLANQKILPLPWAEISEEIPAVFLNKEIAAESDHAGFVTITRSSPLLWYSAISWKCCLSCRRRGYYKLGPLAISSGDIFGFYPRTLIEPDKDHLIVYPRLFNIDHLSLPASYPLGEALAERRLFEDPSRAVGVRDYSPGDSLRRIHWKASARQQHLQVKVFESTTTLRVAIFLVVDSFQVPGMNLEDELETAISTAASVSNYLIDKKSQVGLWTNSRLADNGLPARIAVGSGVERLVQILEALAKVTPASFQSFPEFFQSEREHLPSGSTLIFILSTVSPDLKTMLIEAKNSGYKTLVFQTSEAGGSETINDIPWYKVNSSGQITETHTGGYDAVY